VLFHEHLEHALARTRRGGDSLAVLCIDLDHFKHVNDTFGHAVGDKVLQAFARSAEAQVRGGDMLARIGGEEFGLIFSNITPEQAQMVCERIRTVVAATQIKAGDWPVAYTVSIGIGAFCSGDDPAEVMRRSDKALYWSKQQGRNRSSLAA
jgi:diguanylate cyclase (GGDEF)-like protein